MTTPCGHTFCKHCSHNLRRAGNGTALCPIDRKPIPQELCVTYQLVGIIQHLFPALSKRRRSEIYGSPAPESSPARPAHAASAAYAGSAAHAAAVAAEAGAFAADASAVASAAAPSPQTFAFLLPAAADAWEAWPAGGNPGGRSTPHGRRPPGQFMRSVDLEMIRQVQRLGALGHHGAVDRWSGSDADGGGPAS